MSDTTKYVLGNVLKILLVIIIALFLFALGTMIGYGGIGEGKMLDVFKSETWTHITDFL